MFERYTEKARRAIFFARYEASQYGSTCIDTEHLLLGILREDKVLTTRLLRPFGSAEAIRRKIAAQTTVREFVSTSVDMPLSGECLQVMAHAADEAEQLSHSQIGTAHLVLGLLREEQCFAAKLLREHGVQTSTFREEIARTYDTSQIETPPTAPGVSTVAVDSSPLGAEIEVDNAFLGQTPAILPLALGERLIAITKPGYKTWQRKLCVLPGGRQKISAELERDS
jgi:ATP-dependent Clp protease ATP-binding subunit ClpA